MCLRLPWAPAELFECARLHLRPLQVTGVAAVVDEAIAMDFSGKATNMDAVRGAAVIFFPRAARDPTAHEVSCELRSSLLLTLTSHAQHPSGSLSHTPTALCTGTSAPTT